MAKIYYNQRTHQFEVAQYNVFTQCMEVIDSDTDFDALGTRQGFLSDDEADEDDDYVDEEE